MLVGEGSLEIVSIQLALLFGTQHETDLLDATPDEFFEQDEDDRAHHTIGTRNGEEIFLQGPGGGIETCAKACHRDNRLTHRMYRLEREGIGLQALCVEVVDQLLLRLLTTCQELYRAIAMGADALTTPHHRLDVGIAKHLMEFGSIESLRHRGHLGIEEGFSLGHQPTQSFCIALCHALDGAIHQFEVLLTQRLMLRPFGIAIGEGIGLVEVGEDLDGVFLGTEVGKDPVEMFLDIEGTHLDLIAIEGHEVGLDTEGTGLVETTTTTGGAQFAQIGDVHLAQRVEVEMI